jgi:uncharacterized protein YbjT (DUF2867 family)
MYIILGGTGNVGSAVAESLLKREKEVTVLTHSPEKVSGWEEKGAKVEVVDVYDSTRLHEIFKTGKRLFLLNPPADVKKDSVAEEQRSLSSILTALENSGIEKVVAESTYGAQKGVGIGDLGVLFEMEERLKAMNLRLEIIRAAYYMSNWAMAVESAAKEGKVYTFYPADFKLPMVSPSDIGKIAADLLIGENEETKIHYVEGPETYSSKDVADAFGKALNKTVEAVEIPKEKWLPTFKEFGFSDASARSMAKMTEITLEEIYEKPDSPVRGRTTLDEYIAELASNREEK